MKMVLLAFYLSFISSVALSQGLVSFYNSSSTLVSAGTPGQTQLISPSSQATYYFGLCTAPPGTTDSTMFTFAGIYATNASVAGQLNGGFQAVVGWLPGVQESFFVAGWS